MAARRPIFYRKEQPRSISKAGFMLCLLLAGGVMLVPVGGDVAHIAKLKLRDLALTSGLIDFQDCVVTPEHALVCSSHAIGAPLPVALRQIADSEAQAAAEKEQRQKAERKIRALALEVERLDALARQAQVAKGKDFFPAVDGDIRPTGRAVTNPSTGSMMSTAAQPQAEQPQEITPPSEED
jgi:hypothetical protein